jgi:uncharacterized protein
MTCSNNIIDKLEYSEEEGLLTFKGIRYLILRPETIMGLYKTLKDKYGKDVDSHFFQGGFEAGRLTSQKYKENFGLDNMGLIDFMIKTGGQIGWGKFELVRFELNEKILEIKLTNCAFISKDKFLEFPVCHFVLGVMSGMASILFSSEVSGEEIKCMAKGDECCFFKINGLNIFKNQR